MTNKFDNITANFMA